MEELLAEKELSILQKTIKSFINEQVAPLERSQKGYLKEFSETAAAALQEKARVAGLSGLGAKKEWGGAGLSLYSKSVIYEEAAKHRLGLYHPAGDAFGEDLPSFLENCSLDQVEAYVKPAVLEGKGCFIAAWEELEDNNFEKLTTTAIKDEDNWVINGKKSYIRKLEKANFGVVLVNCLDENGETKPTLFIVELNDPFEKQEKTLIDVQKTHDLIFNNVHLPDWRRVGSVGEGAHLMKQWLTESQILLGARCLGVSEKAIEYAKEYAKLRITRGQPLSEFPVIRTMIANGIVNLNAARLMVQDAAKKVDQGQECGVHAAQMAKLMAAETAAKIIDDVLQIHGGAGFAGDLPIERWYKEIRLARVDLQKKETIIDEIARINL